MFLHIHNIKKFNVYYKILIFVKYGNLGSLFYRVNHSVSFYNLAMVNNVINLKKYNRKKNLQNFISTFEYTYNGRVGNIVSLEIFKQNKVIDKISKNPVFQNTIISIIFAISTYIILK